MKLLFPILMSAIATFAATACSGNKAASTAEPTAEETAGAAACKADADSIYCFAAEQVAFGPRVPGTESHARCHDYLVAKLRQYGAAVTTTDTIVPDNAGGKVRVRNITGVIHPEAERRVLLLAHYDTRPWADKDADSSKHSTPIDGANDGASGVAVLLEIARNATAIPDNLGVEILFVDAEDAGLYDGNDATWCIGSQLWSTMRGPGDRHIDYGILLDMVGGRNATFHREYFSERYARPVNDKVWSTARKLGYASRFPDEPGGALNDDHLYVLAAGIPCIDIVENRNPDTGSFNPTWHTTDDNIDNLDPVTMKIVADIVLDILTH